MSRASQHTPRLSLLACALALAVPGLAQDVSGSQRFTPVLGSAEALYPQSPATTGAASRVVDRRSGEVD